MIGAGDRRFRAALPVGLAEVPCLIRDPDDEDAYVETLLENLQREDVPAAEELLKVRDPNARSALVEDLAKGRLDRQSLRRALPRMNHRGTGTTGTVAAPLDIPMRERPRDTSPRIPRRQAHDPSRASSWVPRLTAADAVTTSSDPQRPVAHPSSQRIWATEFI